MRQGFFQNQYPVKESKGDKSNVVNNSRHKAKPQSGNKKEIDWNIFRPCIAENEDMVYVHNKEIDGQVYKSWYKNDSDMTNSYLANNYKFVKTSSRVLPVDCSDNYAILPYSGICYQPFADLSEENGHIPMIDARDSKIARCGKCNGYMSPFVRYQMSDDIWTCAMCGHETELIMDEYFNQDLSFFDEENSQIELKYPVYEYQVPSGYFGSNMKFENLWVFVIDNTRKSREYYKIPYMIIDSLKQILSRQTYEIKVCFMMYDSKIRWITKNSEEEQKIVELLDISDMDSGLLFADEIMFTISPLDENENSKLIENQFNLLDVLFSNFTANETPSNYIQAPSCGLETLLKNIMANTQESGGKICLFATQLGDFENIFSDDRIEGNLKHFVGDKVQLKKLYRTNYSLDIWLFGDSIPMEMIADYPDRTGGTLYYHQYPNEYQIIVSKIYYELDRNITRFYAKKCQFKLRGSSNVTKIMPLMHNGYFNDEHLWFIPYLDCDKEQSYSFTIKDNNIWSKKHGEYCFFQYACLYTDCYNNRIVRIINTKVPTSVYPFEVIESSNSELSFCLQARKKLVKDYKFSKAENFQKIFKDALIALQILYRNSMTSKYNPQAFVIAENLRTLPTLTFCLNYSELGSILYPKRNYDNCEYIRRKIMSSTTYWVMNYLYPKIYSLDSLNYLVKKENIFDDDDSYSNNGNHDSKQMLKNTNKAIIPPTVPTNLAYLDFEGYFLIDNGEDLIIYIQEDCNNELVEKIHQNKQNLEYFLMSENEEEIVDPDSHENQVYNLERKELYKLITWLREIKNGQYHNLFVVKNGDHTEKLFVFRNFTEERDKFDCKMLQTFQQNMHMDVLKIVKN